MSGSAGGATAPAVSTMAFNMSTKAPDMGRLDQRGSAVTWNSTMRPLPCWRAVTSGVPVNLSYTPAAAFSAVVSRWGA